MRYFFPTPHKSKIYQVVISTKARGRNQELDLDQLCNTSALRSQARERESDVGS